jgi:hypothetical protein
VAAARIFFIHVVPSGANVAIFRVIAWLLLNETSEMIAMEINIMLLDP